MTTDQIPAAARPASDRGAATRSGLLAAARAVFISEGYDQAAVTDIVARAGASVGSLYHHFPGKAALYLALFDELHTVNTERTRAAVRHARDTGMTDPMQLFLIGARAYLDGSIAQHELASLFARADGPPGFELVWQERLLEWVRKNTEFFARSGEPLDEAVSIVMTGAMMLALSEVSRAEDDRRARQVADGVISVLSRLEMRSQS
jgi:AcrR family transcriptional regulator